MTSMGCLHKGGWIAILYGILILGLPSSRGWDSCAHSLARLSLNAVGVEASTSWALLKVGPNGEDELFNVGDVAFGCFQVSEVNSSSVVLKDISSQTNHAIFFGGSVGKSTHKTLRASENVALAERKLHETLLGADTYSAAPNVTRIKYPLYSNRTNLPRSIYWNRDGEALFNDSEKIGLGVGAELVIHTDDNSSGVILGANSANSVLGGYGFIKGDEIVSIGGYDIKSIDDVGRLLKSAGDKPTPIVYRNGQVAGSGLLTTYLAIRSPN